MAKSLEISLLLDFYGDILTDEQRCVIEYHYNDDLSLAEIVDSKGITRQSVRDFIKRAESQLPEMGERLGLARRFHEMHGGLEQIHDAAEQIRIYNSQSIFSQDAQQDVSLIEDTTRRLCEEWTRGLGEQWRLKD